MERTGELGGLNPQPPSIRTWHACIHGLKVHTWCIYCLDASYSHADIEIFEFLK